MKIYAFHAPLPKAIFPIHDQLIELWAQTWSEAGWEPVLLGMPHAAEHPDFERFSKIVMQYPTVNPEGFDYVCWARWLAYERAGAGFISDYDCLNLGWPPPAERPTESCTYAFNIPYFEGANSLIHLKQEDLQRFLVRMETEPNQLFYRHVNGRDQVSDMVFFNHMARKGNLSIAPRMVQHSYETPIHCPVIHLTPTSGNPAEKLALAHSILKRA